MAGRQSVVPQSYGMTVAAVDAAPENMGLDYIPDSVVTELDESEASDQVDRLVCPTLAGVAEQKNPDIV
jgi:hypothetical protein